tara:strand:- start:98 stop:568 length:471 start_codon:yes stop_codon:yes gene_type:complete
MWNKLDQHGKFLLGTGLAFLAAILYGISQVIAKKGVTEYGVPPVVFLFVALFFATILMFISGWPSIKSIRYFPRNQVLLLAGAGLTSGLSVTLLVSALDRAPVVVVTPIVALNPIVSLTLIYFFLRRLERVTKRVVLGTGIALSGAIFVIIGSTDL